MPLPSSALGDLATDVLAACVARWSTEAPTALDLPDRQFITAGVIAWDCEQIVVAVEGTVGIGDADPLLTQPTAISARAGWVMRLATLAVWITRCYPDMADDGEGGITFPAADDITAAAGDVLQDTIGVLRCVAAAHKAGELGGCNDVSFVGSDNLGPEGGFVGTVLRLTVVLE